MEPAFFYVKNTNLTLVKRKVALFSPKVTLFTPIFPLLPNSPKTHDNVMPNYYQE